MIKKRYANDGRPCFRLNAVQYAAKNEIDAKIASSIYRFEAVRCAVCGVDRTHFKILSEKDRYGLYMPVMICKQCGLIQTNPRMDQASYNHFYNEEYRRLYSGRERASEDIFQSHQERGRAILKYLSDNSTLPRPISGSFVLEIGCSSGGVLEAFRAQGARVKGLDVSKEYTDYGREKYGLDLSTQQLSDVRLGSPPDIVILSHVVEHLLDPGRILTDIRSILSDSSVVYIEIPGVKNIIRGYGSDYLRLMQNAHTYHFTLTTLNNLLEKYGFRMVVGDERVFSVFKKDEGCISGSPKNDYTAVLGYLRKAENIRMAKSLLYPFTRVNDLRKKIIRQFCSAS